MDGFENIENLKDPVYSLPSNWEGMKICLLCNTGLGDILIISAGLKTLKSVDCEVTLAVKPHQISLVQELEHADHVISFRDADLYKRNFDVVLDFDGVIATQFHIREGSYFSLVEKWFGFPIGLGKFKSISRNPIPRYEGRSAIYLHPGASNPNRRWKESHWKELAYEIRDRKLHVFWLGTKDEYGFNDEGITKLSDQDEDFVWQVKHLAEHGSYLIGNDSGFAHIAGILNIPGCILFFSTCEEDVIGRYPDLKGVDCFEELQCSPTRSLNVEDTIAQHASNLLTANDVLSACGLDIIEKEEMERQTQPASRLTIGIIGSTVATDELASFLAQHYDVEIVEELPSNGRAFDVGIAVSDEDWVATITAKSGVAVQVGIVHPENVRRAIREVLNKD
jgi:ADP-heptose:LPS heptosyltransferase